MHNMFVAPLNASNCYLTTTSAYSFFSSLYISQTKRKYYEALFDRRVFILAVFRLLKYYFHSFHKQRMKDKQRESNNNENNNTHISHIINVLSYVCCVQ